MPSPRSESYRNQVQTRIIDLVSGNRPRDPHLRTVSTQRLILEGIVEEIRIYRLGKEEEKRRQKDRNKREKRRMAGHDKERSRSRERRKHRHERSGRRHYRRDNSGERDRRRESRDRSRARRCHGRPDRGISDLVTEGRPDPNPDLMMTGGAGPAGTLPPTPKPQSESPSHHPNPGTAGISRSPTRRHGPDGKKPFGQLPKKTAAIGFVAHALNTYKHIKAEHEAGHRSRGVLERTVDEWRGKKPGSAASGGGGGDNKGKRGEPEKLKKEDRWRRAEEKGRRDDRGRDEGRVGRGRRKHRDHHRNDGRKDDQGSRRGEGVDVRSDHTPRDVEREFDRPERRNPQYAYDYIRAPDEDTPPKSFSPHRTGPGDAQLPYRPPHGRPPHAVNDHSRATVTDTPVRSVPPHQPAPSNNNLPYSPPGAPPRATYDDLYAQPSPAPSVHPRAAEPVEHTSALYPPSPRAPPHTTHDDLYAHPSPAPSVHVQEATPPSFHHDEAPVWTPTPDMPRPHIPASLRPDRSAFPDRPAPTPRHEKSPSRERFESRLAAERPITPSPPYSPPSPERCRSPSRSPSPPYPEPPSDRSISPIQMPPPPGNSAISPRKPLPSMPKATPNHAALFGQIQGNTPKLRKVRSRDKKDMSTPDSAGHVYEETAHSHDVEERERRQTWMSDDGGGDGEEESKGRKELFKKLGK